MYKTLVSFFFTQHLHCAYTVILPCTCICIFMHIQYTHCHNCDTKPECTISYYIINDIYIHVSIDNAAQPPLHMFVYCYALCNMVEGLSSDCTLSSDTLLEGHFMDPFRTFHRNTKRELLHKEKGVLLKLSMYWCFYGPRLSLVILAFVLVVTCL